MIQIRKPSTSLIVPLKGTFEIMVSEMRVIVVVAGSVGSFHIGIVRDVLAVDVDVRSAFRIWPT